MNIGFLYAIGAAIIWGLVYTIDQRILINMSPITLIFANAIISLIVLLPFVFFDHGSIKTFIGSGKWNIVLVVASVLLAILANFCIFSGIKLVGASAASIIEIMYPFFVVLFSFILLRAAPSLSIIIGGILIFIGSAVIVYFH
jgi:drug/metabolite transporter (DMT)-like permease